mgnify:CR=1 FL=1|tara:strand:+ start:3433 stop:4284 length:852 start_codon:yes stop_codon:yes gene_type:complete
MPPATIGSLPQKGREKVAHWLANLAVKALKELHAHPKHANDTAALAEVSSNFLSLAYENDVVHESAVLGNRERRDEQYDAMRTLMTFYKETQELSLQYLKQCEHWILNGWAKPYGTVANDRVVAKAEEIFVKKNGPFSVLPLNDETCTTLLQEMDAWINPSKQRGRKAMQLLLAMHDGGQTLSYEEARELRKTVGAFLKDAKHAEEEADEEEEEEKEEESEEEEDEEDDDDRMPTDESEEEENDDDDGGNADATTSEEEESDEEDKENVSSQRKRRRRDDASP